MELLFFRTGLETDHLKQPLHVFS